MLSSSESKILFIQKNGWSGHDFLFFNLSIVIFSTFRIYVLCLFMYHSFFFQRFPIEEVYASRREESKEDGGEGGAHLSSLLLTG